MVVVCVVSLDRGSGKTAVCAGLGSRLLSDGKKPGYLKLLITGGESLPAKDDDADADFMKRLLALAEPLDLICPTFSDEPSLRGSIKQVLARVSQGKDVVLIETDSRVAGGIVETLDARVIVVEGYSKELPKTINSQKDFGKHLLGIVLNKVPRSRLEQVRREVSAQFEKAGVSVLGVIPEDRSLLAPTIGDLAMSIQGEVLSGADKTGALVENVMLGTLWIDPGPYYFGRKAVKAVVLRSERPDMQLAALETPTRCLVLTGRTPPRPAVLHRAEEEHVPVILTKDDVATVIAKIEDALSKTRLSQDTKLPRLAEIMEQHFNFRAVYEGLGLAG